MYTTQLLYEMDKNGMSSAAHKNFPCWAGEENGSYRDILHTIQLTVR